MKLTKAANVPCLIAIDRMKYFISLVDACNYIGLPSDLLRKIDSVTPSDVFLPESQRDNMYHLRKIKYYVEHGIDKPIDVDCFCRDTRVYNWPVIVDGRHRYIAALLRHDKTIPATYSGTPGLLAYLTFRSNNKPAYSGNIL